MNAFWYRFTRVVREKELLNGSLHYYLRSLTECKCVKLAKSSICFISKLLNTQTLLLFLVVNLYVG